MAKSQKEHPAVGALQKQYDEIEKRNIEAMKRQEAKPTPTQAENDLARLGCFDPAEPKEHDETAPTEDDVRKSAAAPPPPDAAVLTREATEAAASKKS